MRVELAVQRATTSSGVPDDAQFQHWVEAVPAGKPKSRSLTIRIVDETEAARFNRQYRNQDYATNVLSFMTELPEGLPAEVRQSQLGDLLICAPVVLSEARKRCRSEADHWAHLTIHGVLHLLGYDHEQPDEARLMESMETEILANLDISDPYLDVD